MRWHILLPALAVAIGGCAGMFGPSEARLVCLADCAKRNDACILEATGSAGVQACDQANQQCIQVCPA